MFHLAVLATFMAGVISNSIHVAESDTDDSQERFDVEYRVPLLIEVSLWYIVFCLSKIVLGV